MNSTNVLEVEYMATIVEHRPEYKALTQAVMLANGYDQEQAESALDDALIDIEQGNASYASAAMGLNLHVNLAGECGFDAADYMSAII
jgi:hypothetical protein